MAQTRTPVRCATLWLPLMLGMLAVSAVPAFAQEAAWTGQAQCQLNVQASDYAHQEIQTWTITGGARTQQGAMQVYPGTWSITSQGGTQRTIGPQILMARWSSNVAPINAPIAVFIRASDNRLIIKPWHSQVLARGGLTGVRQLSTGSAAPTQSATATDAYEWPFPAINDVAMSTNVSGTGTIVVSGSIMPMQPASTTATANCQWQFSKGASAPAQQAPPEEMESMLTATATRPAAGTIEISHGALSPAPPPPADSASAGNLSTSAAITKEPVQPAQTSSQLISQLQPLPAPAAFAAQHLGNGVVQFTWQPVSGASKYRLEGSGISSAGLYLAVTSNPSGQGVPPPPPVVQNVPPGPGTWRLAAVNAVDRWDANAEATASAMVRYPPAHSPQWLTKSNGAGTPGSTLAHYLSLCNQCIPGANFKDIMQALGLSFDPLVLESDPDANGDPFYGSWGSPWVDGQAARYTNVTEFENSARVTGCWTIGRPNGRIICYTKTSDHGLQVIVKQTDFSWFLSFSSGDPNAEVLDWVTYDSNQLSYMPLGQRLTSAYTLANRVTFDSEGTKYPPNACLSCHGGKVTSGGVTGATLLPLDPGLIKPTTFSIAGSDYYYDAGNVRKVNQAVMDAAPSAAVARYLTGLYGADPHVASGPGDPNYVPKGWKQQANVYNTAIKPHCVMCHLATQTNLDFTIPSNFYQNKDLVYTAVCSAHSMPHAEGPYKAFWTKDTGPFFMPGWLVGQLGYQSCP